MQWCVHVSKILYKSRGHPPPPLLFLYKCILILSYIYLGSSVCHIPLVLSSCHPVILLSCLSLLRNAGLSLCFSNQTDQGDETEGLEREGLEMKDRRWRDWRGRVWIDLSLFKPNLVNMTVHSATYRCSVELYKQWYTLADFFPNWNFRGVFSTLVLPFIYVPLPSVCLLLNVNVCYKYNKQFKYKRRRIRREIWRED